MEAALVLKMIDIKLDALAIMLLLSQTMYRDKEF